MKVRGYEALLFDAVSKGPWVLRPLGGAGIHQIWHVLPTYHRPDAPTLLIAGGHHGDEQGGSLGILRYIQFINAFQDLPRANVSFLPILNPRAFNRGVRVVSKRVNCGFIHGRDELFEDGRILKYPGSNLRRYSEDGFLTLHECENSKEFYAYTFGHYPSACSVRDCGKKLFGVLPNKTPVHDDEGVGFAHNGLVHNLHDGSLEDWLFHEGARVSIATEVPIQGTDMEERVHGHTELIDAFISARIKYHEK